MTKEKLDPKQAEMNAALFGAQSVAVEKCIELVTVHLQDKDSMTYSTPETTCRHILNQLCNLNTKILNERQEAQKIVFEHMKKDEK